MYETQRVLETWERAILDVSVATGRNAKIAYLTRYGKDKVLREILHRAYHPYMRYYLNGVPMAGQGKRTLESTFAYWPELLDKLSKREISGNFAKNLVMEFVRTLRPFDAEIFNNILRKDLDIGVAQKTLSAMFPDLVPSFGVMLAQAYKPRVDYGTLYMSLKYDGLRALYKDGVLYTRSGRVINGLSHLESALVAAGAPALDGELIVPGREFNTASGKLRSLADTPDAVYQVFDLPESDLIFRDRLPQIAEAIASVNHEQVRLITHKLVTGHQHIMRNYVKARQAGYEGLMLKEPFHKYTPKRSASWLKMKAIETLDLPIVGFFEGQGKYVDKLGGVFVEHKGVTVRIGGGFTDAQRELIWQNRPNYLGDVIEVAFQEETPDGSLRLPRFLGFRPDLC